MNLSSSNLYSYAGTVSSDGKSTTIVPSTGSSGLTAKPDLTVMAGNTGNINARVYAETQEEMIALSNTVSWSSSNSSVAEVKNGGFIQATSPAVYSGEDGSYSLWYASGLVNVTGKKKGSAVITGKLTDGTSITCNVTVTEPEAAGSVAVEGNGGSLEIGEDKESSAEDGKSGVAQFFPATWSLSSTKYPVQISQKENTDGTYTLKASIGIGKSDLLDKDTEWSKYKKACKAANKNASSYDTLASYRELFGLKSSTAIHSSGWSGKKPSLSVMGYVEVKYDKYGNKISSEGKIAGDLSWSGEISWQFATPIGPMYLKLGAEGKASLEGGPSWDNKNKKMSLDGSFSITPSISLTGGYGIDKVASISATGKASVGVQAYPASKGTFTAEASVNVYALFVINHTWTLAKYTKEMWDTTGKKKSAGNSLLGRPQEMTFMDTDFALEDTGWTGEKKTRSRQQSMRNLKEGLLPSSLPMLAALGEKQVMVWQDYDETREVANSSVLMYSVYDNGIWSEPEAVCDDGYGDACADLQVIDGKIHLTWQKHKVKVSTKEADTAMSQMAEKAEIYYAQFDALDNTFTHVTQVTDNASCDMMPEFVKGTNKVQIAYVKNDANNMLQSEGTNTIYTVVWNGSVFEEEELLAESPGTIERYVSYAENGNTKAMYVTQANGIIAVQSSEGIVAEGLGELMSLAEDGTISSIDYADGQIRFIQNGILYVYDSVAEKVTSYTAGEGTFDGTAVYCTNGTKSGYIWSIYDEETGKGRIIASMSTDTGYSDAVTIYETDGEISRHMAPVLTEDGDWNIALNQENIQSGLHSLSWLYQEEKQKTSLVAAYVNEADVVNGLTGVEYVFTNTGDVAVDRITMQITLADNTVIEKPISVTVWPGETVSGTEYVDLSQVEQGQDIHIALYESGQMPGNENIVLDVLEQNNISLVGTAVESEGKIKVTAYATNKEKQQATTGFTLYGDADKQNVLAFRKEITVPAGQTKSVTFTVKPEQIQYNENNAAYLTLYAEVENGDYDMADNIAYLALYKGEKVNANTEEKGIEDSVVESDAKDQTTNHHPSPIKIQKLKISAISNKLAAGKKVKLSVSITPKNAANKTLTWKSSNNKYATVNAKGVLSLKKEGAGKTVTITAATKDGSNIKASYKIKIMKHAVKHIRLKAGSNTVKAGKSLNVKAGKSLNVKATIKTTGKKANKTLKWTSGNTKYATVSKKGKVKTKKAGKGKTVKITARATDGSNKKASIKIKIK